MFVLTQQDIQKIRIWCHHMVNDEESTAKQPTHQVQLFLLGADVYLEASRYDFII